VARRDLLQIYRELLFSQGNDSASTLQFQLALRAAARVAQSGPVPDQFVAHLLFKLAHDWQRGLTRSKPRNGARRTFWATSNHKSLPSGGPGLLQGEFSPPTKPSTRHSGRHEGPCALWIAAGCRNVPCRCRSTSIGNGTRPANGPAVSNRPRGADVTARRGGAAANQLPAVS